MIRSSRIVVVFASARDIFPNRAFRNCIAGPVRPRAARRALVPRRVVTQRKFSAVLMLYFAHYAMRSA